MATKKKTSKGSKAKISKKVTGKKKASLKGRVTSAKSKTSSKSKVEAKKVKKSSTSTKKAKPKSKTVSKSTKSLKDSKRSRAKQATKKTLAAKKIKPTKSTANLSGRKKLPVVKTVLSKAKLSQLFSPLDDRILLEVGEESNMTPGGIIIPASVTEKPQTGKVLAIGRGHRSQKGKVRPMDVKVGDKVLYPKYSGDEVEVGGLKLLILREGDILGVSNS